eukprot:6192415-Pleurochrysis_carterae.AAC.1
MSARDQRSMCSRRFGCNFRDKNPNARSTLDFGCLLQAFSRRTRRVVAQHAPPRAPHFLHRRRETHARARLWAVASAVSARARAHPGAFWPHHSEGCSLNEHAEPSRNNRSCG